jgi:hypothetical protein
VVQLAHGTTFLAFVRLGKTQPVQFCTDVSFAAVDLGNGQIHIFVGHDKLFVAHKNLQSVFGPQVFANLQNLWGSSTPLHQQLNGCCVFNLHFGKTLTKHHLQTGVVVDQQPLTQPNLAGELFGTLGMPHSVITVANLSSTHTIKLAFSNLNWLVVA